ncbi:MAG: hypothetical protein IV100_01630 [Myxococcales bacterium]|nr:hypothetical protein [Myxococcales bacterium]
MNSKWSLPDLYREAPALLLDGDWRDPRSGDRERVVAALGDQVLRDGPLAVDALHHCASVFSGLSMGSLSASSSGGAGRGALDFGAAVLEKLDRRISDFLPLQSWIRALAARLDSPEQVEEAAQLLWSTMNATVFGPLRPREYERRWATPTGIVLGDVVLPSLASSDVLDAVSAYNQRHALNDVPPDLDPTRLDSADVAVFVDRCLKASRGPYPGTKVQPFDLAHPRFGLFAGDGFGPNALAAGVTVKRVEGFFEVTPAWHEDDLRRDLAGAVRLVASRQAARDHVAKQLGLVIETREDRPAPLRGIVPPPLLGFETELRRACRIAFACFRRSVIDGTRAGTGRVRIGDQAIPLDSARSLADWVRC